VFNKNSVTQMSWIVYIYRNAKKYSTCG